MPNDRFSKVWTGTLLAAALWTGSADAQVLVDFSPSTVNLNIGESALVEVNVTGVPAGGLAAFQLDFAFGPVPIELLNPNEAFRGAIDPFAPLGGNPLCTTVRGTATCDDPAWLLTSTGRTAVGADLIDNPGGVVQVAYGTHGAPAPAVGDGTIAMIEVFGAWDGTVSVDLAGVILADDQEPPGTFAVTPGSLTVVVGTGVANLPPVLSPIGDHQVYESSPLSIAIASSDPDGNGLILSASGLPAFCTLTDNGDGSGRIDCAPLPGDAGIYPVTVTTTDDGGPNLSDAETFDLIVDQTNCVDSDSDGFGFPGDASCLQGPLTDCDDTNPAVHPAAPERCRNTLDDDCSGEADGLDPVCPSPVCLTIVLGPIASDPEIELTSPSLCPPSGALARPVDVVWGDVASLRVEGIDVKLGTVSQVVCADYGSVKNFDNLRPDPGRVDFFLVRETGQVAYGFGSGSLARLPDLGDCP